MGSKACVSGKTFVANFAEEIVHLSLVDDCYVVVQALFVNVRFTTISAVEVSLIIMTLHVSFHVDNHFITNFTLFQTTTFVLG